MVMGRASRRESDTPPAQSVEDLFVQHYARLCQLAVRMLGDPMRAEDVVMDAFLEVHRVVERLDWQTAPAYVRRAVVNRCLRVLQRAASEERLVDRAARERLLPAEVGYGIDHQALSAERDRILLAVAPLPPRERWRLSFRTMRTCLSRRSRPPWGAVKEPLSAICPRRGPGSPKSCRR